MTSDTIETVVRAELHRIAPDIDVETIDRDADLREEFDIDSMDFLNLVTALGKNLGTAMPESDYPRMATFDAMIAYLDEVRG